VANLLEHVSVIDQGRTLMDQDAEELRSSATTVVGPRSAVDAFVASHEVLHRDGIGGLASVTVSGLSGADRAAAGSAGLELAPVSLQQLIVRKTNVRETEFEQSA
jgi:ABC-2 type transport system ATP-binding protein